MRIIDKNTDYYDFYQNVYRDNTFTFDRRNSFLLTKQIVCDNLDRNGYWSFRTKRYEPKTHNHALLQIGNTFWLFLIEVTEMDKTFLVPKNYNIELTATWKNYNKSRALCRFETIYLYYPYSIYNKQLLKKKKDSIIKVIDTNNYKVLRRLDTTELHESGRRVKKNIPILKACGISKCVDAHDIYLAFEEYFSLQKTASERRDPIGTTDIDKIESHGFDKKTSFRGK